MCGLGIVASDYALVEISTEFGKVTRPIHQQCTSLLWDMAEELNATAEDSEVEGPAEEDGLDS
jgi:hypothetical protein